MPLRLDARLAEIHHGAWEGNPAAVIREQYADEYLGMAHRAASCENARRRIAGRCARDGCTDFLQDLLAEHADGNILIATHDAVLRVILLQTLLMGLEFFWRWRFDNASVSMFETIAGRTFSPGVVERRASFRRCFDQL